MGCESRPALMTGGRKDVAPLPAIEERSVTVKSGCPLASLGASHRPVESVAQRDGGASDGLGGPVHGVSRRGFTASGAAAARCEVESSSRMSSIR
jgi:hypothetical protein